MTGVLPFIIPAVPASIKKVFANARGYYCFVFACLFRSYPYFLEVFIIKLWLEKKGYEN